MRGGGSDDEAALGGGAASPGLKKGPWTGSEDAILVEYVRKHGEGNWNAVQKNSGLSRCGKSCRLRWANHLRPHLKKGSFTPEEELLILRLHAQLGNKWARMAAQLPGRTDNEIKNYWNTRIKRRQRAGLPLYPPEIHRQTAVHHRPSLTVAPSVNLCDTTAGFPSKPVLELPTIKRIHNNGVFQFFASPSPLALYGSPSATGEFGLGNFHPNPAPAPDVSVKTELPSSQCHMFPEPPVGAGDGNSGLLDALLLEPQGVGGEPPPPPAAGVAGSGGGGDFVSKLDDFTGMEKKSGEAEAMEIDQVQENHITMLLDMIPATTTDHWYNSTDSGQSSSAVTEDEIGLEMQQLASSLSIAPAEGDWGIGSCSWNNMPGIC